MRILITGSRGALGRALKARLPDANVQTCDRPDCDVTQPAQVRQAVQAARPEVVVHCAAMTDVDGCARDPERAYEVNGLGTRNVAEACAEAGAALVYISTNEVFDGLAQQPYGEFEATNPINAYGHSKLAGERFALEIASRCSVVRTAWLYAPGGHNFIHKILKLAGEGRSLRVVSDETASPTLVSDLAEALVSLIEANTPGTYHLTNEGYCSRYEWARTALELTGRADWPVEPIRLAEFERPSVPPPFTPLANNCAAALGIRLRPWQAALAEFLSWSQ